jgi:hypothetical protein
MNTITNINRDSFLFKLLCNIEENHKNNNHSNIPNLLFTGDNIENINKIVKIICNILSNKENYLYDIKIRDNHNIFFLDCVINPSIVNIRKNVHQFIKSKFISSQGYKIIIFNYLDSLSDEAQCALRVLMEENNTNLFIGIAYNKNNIVQPILSRMLLVNVCDFFTNICNIKNNTINNNRLNKIYEKMKYNKYTHWLYNKRKINIKNISTIYNEIIKELTDLGDYNIIEYIFKELYTNILEKKCIRYLEYKNNCDIETYISFLLSDYIVVMSKLLTDEK